MRARAASAFDDLIAAIGRRWKSTDAGRPCDWAGTRGARPLDLPVEGAAALKAAVITVVLHYTTTGPSGLTSPHRRPPCHAHTARAQMALAFETAHGTCPAGGYRLMPFARTIAYWCGTPLLNSDLLGYGRSPALFRTVTADGEVVVPIDGGPSASG